MGSTRFRQFSSSLERREFHCSVEPSCVHKWKTIIEQGKLNEATRGACVDLSFVSCN